MTVARRGFLEGLTGDRGLRGTSWGQEVMARLLHWQPRRCVHAERSQWPVFG